MSRNGYFNIEGYRETWVWYFYCLPEKYKRSIKKITTEMNMWNLIVFTHLFIQSTLLHFEHIQSFREHQWDI